MTRHAAHRPRLRRPTGFTLVELLVAMAVTGALLAAAWGWLWDCAAVARGADRRAQDATAAAFAARMLRDDLEAAVSLATPPPAYSPARALCLVHRHPGAAVETVLIVWDPARRVLWRKASGSYLAESVRSFSVSYFTADGDAVLPEAGGSGGWPQEVGRVCCRMAIGDRQPLTSITTDVALERP